jgi:hypothetical protein
MIMYTRRVTVPRSTAIIKVRWMDVDNFFYYYSYVHTRFGSFLPPAPTSSLTTHPASSLSPHPLNTQQKLFCPYF